MNSSHNKEIIATLIFSALISLGVYIIIINLCVNPYLENNQKELSLINFYDEKNRNEHNSVYLIGSSQIVEGIDAYIVEDYLEKMNHSFHVYNLGITGDSPLRRVTELNYIIGSKPELIIISLNYNGLLNRTEIPESRLKLVSGRIELDNYSEELFSNEQVQLIQQHESPIEQYIYKRKFASESLTNLFFSRIFIKNNNQGNNFKNPHVYTRNKTQEELLESIDSDMLERWTTVTSDDNPEKRALVYTIRKLKENDINVIVINMPLNPLLSERTPNSTRNNYFDLLNNTGVKYYDFEMKYASDNFIDMTHMNALGRKKMSEEIATLILKEENNVVI